MFVIFFDIDDEEEEEEEVVCVPIDSDPTFE